MKRGHVDFDYKEGIEAAQQIVDAYLHNRGVFADTRDLLENQLPVGVAPKTCEHSNFLFFLISQDHGVKSRLLYQRAKDLFQEDPGLFDPGIIVSRFSHAQPEVLRTTIASRLGTRYPNETARQWYENAVALADQYRSDARNIFSMSRDSVEAMRRIRALRGFGPKTGALLFRTFYGCGFFQLPRKEEVEIPVDIHDTRIAYTIGLLIIDPSPQEITSGNYMRYASAAQQAWITVCRRAQLDWLVLDRALWLLGSRGCSPDVYLTCCV
jgi:endonuclease III